MEIVYRKLSDLVPNPKNPRMVGGDAIRSLAESIKENPRFFEARPILLSDRTGVLMIIGGERRSEAAKLLGLTEVPTILLSGLTEVQEDEIMIRDNTHAGVWDEQKLASLGADQLKGWNVEGVKFPKNEPEVVDDDFDPEKKVKSRCQSGMLWKLGRHRLLHGKDLSKADVSVNIYAHFMAQQTGEPWEASCAIGDECVSGIPYTDIVKVARNYINFVGGFEKFAEWGLI